MFGRHSVYLGGYAPLFGSLIALGVPAAKYNLCNSYGDYLGDWTQYHIEALMQLATWDTLTASRLTPRTRRSRVAKLRPSSKDRTAALTLPADAAADEAVLGQAEVEAVVNAVAEAMGAGQAVDSVVEGNDDAV